jgi:AhpC/TSA family
VSGERQYLRAATVAALFALSGLAADNASDLNGRPVDPFSTPGHARVLLFVRTDCPITNRYAPELQRVAREFAGRGVRFWLVYPDGDETAAHIREHVAEYHFPGEPVRDPHHELVRRAHATVAPEAAVFDGSGNLIYHGRIDDRYVDIGKARAGAQVHDLENAIAAVLAGKPVAQAVTHAVGCSLADVE